jgi:UDP-N-acetylglucosamine 1-carboxyvinyltransferase
MDKFVIQGGAPLIGEITISGAKNSILPLMISTLLTDQEIILDNVPYLSDVLTLSELLEYFGVKITAKSGNKSENLFNTIEDTFQVTLNSCSVNKFFAPYNIVKKMRASFWVLGPLLARFGQAKVSLPGGCAIGTRQVNLHLETLKSMGADISLQEGYIVASVKGRLQGTHFTFNQVSVGATISAIMSASIAVGESVFINCAYEPEIVDLCHLLIKMGADIRGIGTSKITVVGKNSLHGAKHITISDRIEAGTYIAAVGLTGGELKLRGIDYNIIENLCEIFIATGLKISILNDAITVSSNKSIKPIDIQTAPYPGFPTDMQAQFMALMCGASHGISKITENIFENRFMHVPELQRMGADIVLNNNLAIVKGNTSFKGANVMASDLRASVCLVIAGLAAEGKTIIDRVYHIDRGYSRIEKKLTQCGAKIARLSC